MIGCLGTDFADSHHLISIDAYWVFEAVAVPELEERDVEADVRGVELLVEDDFFEKASEVFYVVHFFSV